MWTQHFLNDKELSISRIEARVLPYDSCVAIITNYSSNMLVDNVPVP